MKSGETQLLQPHQHRLQRPNLKREGQASSVLPLFSDSSQHTASHEMKDENEANSTLAIINFRTWTKDSSNQPDSRAGTHQRPESIASRKFQAFIWHRNTSLGLPPALWRSHLKGGPLSYPTHANYLKLGPGRLGLSFLIIIIG